MSRWAQDPEQAADALIERCLDTAGLEGRILLVNQGGDLPASIAGRGLPYEVWNRRLTRGYAAAPWPPKGPFDAAVVRLPKARDELDMTAHATFSVMSPGGRLFLYGGNNEGIRSAATVLEAATAGSVEVLASRAHGRVLAARRPPGRRFKDALRDWRIESTVEIAGESRPWISYPGIFAAGRLDGGTALLLGAMPTLPGKAHVLDYGCGSGLVGAAALALRPDIFLDVLDTDAVALEAVHENIDGARLIAGACLADTGRRAYDAILSNPPLHQGFAEDHALLQRLVTDSPAHLTPGGVLQIVVQHRLPLDRLFAEHFTRAETIADDGRYRVWRATRA